MPSIQPGGATRSATRLSPANKWKIIGALAVALLPLACGDAQEPKDVGRVTEAASACQNATYEAETITHSIGSATLGGWNLWSNGYVATTATLVAGPTTIVVWASGTIGGGAWPHMIVSVGGVVIGDTVVNTTAFAAYSFPFTAVAGSQSIRVSFDNDYCCTGGDRNLLIDKVQVVCPSGGAGGASGASGASGSSGASGASGASGTGGASGASGTGGASGASGASGTGGASGASGASGTSGASGASGASGGTCSGSVTYEAESMQHSIGAAVTGGWNLWGNGYASTTQPFGGGATTITVSAYGSIGGGVWPHMIVSVGGTPIGNTTVQSTAWTQYPFTFNAAHGTAELRVTFDNDYCCTSGDRNLYLDKVVVSCAGPCTPTTCAALGKNCGNPADGCGGTLSCGSCTSPQTCGGGGVANLCGAASSDFAKLHALSTKRIYFQHASVGGESVGVYQAPGPFTPPWGIQKIMADNPGSGCLLATTSNTAAAIPTGSIGEWTHGAYNGHPDQKLALFDQFIRGGLGGAMDVAIFKLGGDIDGSTGMMTGVNVAQDTWFSTVYKPTMDALQALYPTMKLIHGTIPIQPGPNYWGNVYLEEWNNRLRTAYPGRVFDLAYWESVNVAGVRAFGADGAPCTHADWAIPSDDHLNEAGANWLGENLLGFLASLP